MKKLLTGSLLPIIFLAAILIAGCKKEDPSTAPILTTSAVSSIQASYAKCGGAISSIGGEAITAQGVCVSKLANPTTSDIKIADASGSRSFAVLMTNLSEGTTYHARAFATNSVGTSYGEDVVFTTSVTPFPDRKSVV